MREKKWTDKDSLRLWLSFFCRSRSFTWTLESPSAPMSPGSCLIDNTASAELLLSLTSPASLVERSSLSCPLDSPWRVCDPNTPLPAWYKLTRLQTSLKINSKRNLILLMRLRSINEWRKASCRTTTLDFLPWIPVHTSLMITAWTRRIVNEGVIMHSENRLATK
jgi:hypothetical protein